MKRPPQLASAAGLLVGGYLLGSLTLGGALAQTPSLAQQPAPQAAQTQTESQDPAYSSSVTVPQDSGGQTEAQEAQALAGKAKVSADQAKAAALAQFPGGTTQQASLEKENGSVVYGVQLVDASGKAQDVKVDAGTSKVLHTEAGGPDAPASGGEETAGAED